MTGPENALQEGEHEVKKDYRSKLFIEVKLPCPAFRGVAPPKMQMSSEGTKAYFCAKGEFGR
jgi:hypothetical protein